VTPLAALTDPAGVLDAEMAFRFVLGRRPTRAADTEAHLGRPLGEVLGHFLRSTEFAQKVRPRLGPAPDALPETLLEPELRAWLETRLRFGAARRWPRALGTWLDAAHLPARPAEDWRRTLPHLLFGPDAALAPPITEGICLAAARQMVLSEAFRARVLQTGQPLPAIPVTPAMRALAQAALLPESGVVTAAASWPALIIALLGHECSHLRLEGAEFWFECGPAEAAGLPVLIALRDRAAPSATVTRRKTGLEARILALAEAGQVVEALRLARRTADENPALAEIWLLLAELLACAGDLPGAETALGRAVRLEPPGEALPLLAARLAIRAGRAEAAMGGLERAPTQRGLLAGPAGPALCFAPPESIAEPMAVLPLLPERPWLLYAALSLQPPAPGAPPALLLALSRTAAARGDAPAARRFAETALEAAPGEAEPMLLRALALRQAGDHQGAADALDAMLDLHPAHEQAGERRLAYELDLFRADPLRLRARLDALLEQRRIVVHRRLTQDPQSPSLRLELARLAIAAGDIPDAQDVLDALALARPGWAAPIAARMYLAQQSNDHAGVMQAWERLPEAARDERAVIAAAKALRQLGEIEPAQALLAAHLAKGAPGIRREHARNHFFAGRFDEAAAECADWGDDPEFGLVATAVALEQGHPGEALRHAQALRAAGAECAFPVELPLFFCAAHSQRGDWDQALAELDPMFARYNARPIRRDPGLGARPFDQLRAAGPAALAEGPKISVVMTSYNAAEHLETAIRSILEQSWRNLELVIVDDASTDATPALLLEMQRRDPRIRVLLKSTNDGTYVSKNMGLLHTTGEFVALQDSDDWSHPDRLALSVGMLRQRPDLVGLTTDWFRMTSEGGIIIKAGGQIAHLCCISLVFRRAPVLERVGFFDSVRVAADLEFIQRIGLVFGERASPRLRWPLLTGRARADSLTAHVEYGLGRTGFTAIRSDYHARASEFHAAIRAGTADARMPFPLDQRRFAAHPMILPDAWAGEGE